MKVGQYCKRDVVTVDTEADVVEAAKLMRAHHVGFLVVLNNKLTERTPVGVITDRDIVVQVDAAEVNPKRVCVGDVMSSKPIVANEDEGLAEVLQAMRVGGVRRVPVVDRAGALVGVIAMDDLIAWIATLLSAINDTIRSEQRYEQRVHV